MHFFNNEIILIRESIQCSTDSSSATGIIEVVISPGVCLESFHLIDLQELTTTLSSSKLSTCILDPVPTRLLKEVLCWTITIYSLYMLPIGKNIRKHSIHFHYSAAIHTTILTYEAI